MIPGIWAGSPGAWWGISGWAVAFLIGFAVVFLIAAYATLYGARP